MTNKITYQQSYLDSHDRLVDAVCDLIALLERLTRDRPEPKDLVG